MKIPSDAIIAHEKLTQYLLVERPKNDKARFLAQAGFTLANPLDLEVALRELLARAEAHVDRQDEYGRYFQVAGTLVGPQRALEVVTIWIELSADGAFRFVTLKPRR